MLMPKKTKWRKSHRAQSKGKATRKISLAFGSFGLKSVESCWVTSRQIEASRRAMARFIKRGGRIWIRIFPDRPVTQKGGEMPMGKGKGGVDHYVADVKAGMVLFEMEGVTEDQAKEAMALAGHKLPVKTKFISKNIQ